MKMNRKNKVPRAKESIAGAQKLPVPGPAPEDLGTSFRRTPLWHLGGEVFRPVLVNPSAIGCLIPHAPGETSSPSGKRWEHTLW